MRGVRARRRIRGSSLTPSAVQRLEGLEVLDSRGQPTVRARCVLRSGAAGAASVPSGRSTGSAEAMELRDNDAGRYRGLGCRRAVALIEDEVEAALWGRNFPSQAELDRALAELDGTPNKARLGANTLLAVSLAFARAAASELEIPLYAHLGSVADMVPGALPRPTINLFSGGRHAGGQVAIQDVLIVPVAPTTFEDALAVAFDVYQAAATLVHDRYNSRLLTADEGGLAPPFPDSQHMIAGAVEAIERAGYEPGADVALAIDVAASHFYRDGRYSLGADSLDGSAMADRVVAWTERFPVISVEDPLAEDDWAHWTELARRLSGRVLVLGDDLLCTNPTRIARAVELEAADALLLKVNQIGTLTEAAEALAMARASGWHVTASARSGETEDTWLADLAVGWGAEHIKVGSITQSDRLAKYNRLLEIEAAGSFGLR
jgi:enolase